MKNTSRAQEKAISQDSEGLRLAHATFQNGSTIKHITENDKFENVFGN